MKNADWLKIGVLGILAFFVLLMVGREPQGTEAATIIETMRLPAAELAGDGLQVAVGADGLGLVDGATAGSFISAPVTAVIPFNVLIPQWTDSLPGNTALELLVRTRIENGEWGDWHLVSDHDHGDHEADDLETEPGHLGEMVAVPAVDTLHQEFQVQITISRFNVSESPLLHDLTFTLIDSTQGPTTEELVAQQEALNGTRGISYQTAGYPRPTVISRDVWCQAAACDYTSGLEYEDASHMIVHHTVSANSSSDWAAVVRAIWAFHTYPPSANCGSCRGWGDIGYNYLIDRNGYIYEGHMNEDYWNLDVVGTHAGDANRGSMGTSLVGTFTNSSEYPVYDVPPQAMQNALMDLFAWKAGQRGIDVFGSSRMPEDDLFWGLPHIMGHRDVYGGLNTLCPGGNAHAMLPAIREGVAARLGFSDGYIYVDELSGDFVKSNANWYEAQRGCGHNLHAYYTFSTTNPGESVNWGEWTLRPPEHGRYRIEIHAPYCNTGEPETYGAAYTVQHRNGSSTVVVNQQEQIGLWMGLGEFDFLGGEQYTVRLSDLTTTDNGRGVWFDGLRFIRVDDVPDMVNLVAPQNNVWFQQQQVAFQWQNLTIYPIASTRLQASTHADFSSLVLDKSWSGSRTSHTETFTTDFAQLYWRVLITVDKNGGQTTIQSPVQGLGIDTTPPVTNLGNVFLLGTEEQLYRLEWFGVDASSGIAGYTVQYRVVGTDTWESIVDNQQMQSVNFSPPPGGESFDLRVFARDHAGNVEQPSSETFISSAQAIHMPNAIMLPIVMTKN